MIVFIKRCRTCHFRSRDTWHLYDEFMEGPGCPDCNNTRFHPTKAGKLLISFLEWYFSTYEGKQLIKGVMRDLA